MNPSAQHSTLCHSEKSVVMSNSQLSSFMNRTYCLLNKYLTVLACQKAHSGACSNFGVKQGMLFNTIMVLLVVPMYSPLMMWTIYFNLWTTVLTGSSMNCRSYSAITDSFPFTTRPSTESFPMQEFPAKSWRRLQRKETRTNGQILSGEWHNMNLRSSDSWTRHQRMKGHWEEATGGHWWVLVLWRSKFLFVGIIYLDLGCSPSMAWLPSLSSRVHSQQQVSKHLLKGML